MTDDRALCDEFVAGFVRERYVAGALSDAETQAFEEHLLECDVCQRELTLAVAVREALADGEADAEPALPRRLPWRGVTVGLTLAAAAVATILVLPTQSVPGSIAELGRVTQPPIYLGVPVRQAPARPDSVFAAAMSRYAEEDYEAAASGLAEALAAGLDAPATRFFLGASLMMMDEDSQAANEFRAVVEAGSSPYQAEGHFYLAKTLLREGDVDGALGHLEETSAIGGPLASQAAALADSVRALSPR